MQKHHLVVTFTDQVMLSRPDREIFPWADTYPVREVEVVEGGQGLLVRSSQNNVDYLTAPEVREMLAEGTLDGTGVLTAFVLRWLIGYLSQVITGDVNLGPEPWIVPGKTNVGAMTLVLFPRRSPEESTPAQILVLASDRTSDSISLAVRVLPLTEPGLSTRDEVEAAIGHLLARTVTVGRWDEQRDPDILGACLESALALISSLREHNQASFTNLQS